MVKKKASGWYGEPFRGITHAGSDDHWIRRLLTMSLAGNGASLVLLANFLKGNNYEITLSNLYANSHPLILFFVGVLAIGFATLAGAWESSVKQKKALDFDSWLEHDAYPFREGPRPIDQVFNDKYPLYRLHSERAWFVLYACLAVSIACFLLGMTNVGLEVAQIDK